MGGKRAKSSSPHAIQPDDADEAEAMDAEVDAAWDGDDGQPKSKQKLYTAKEYESALPYLQSPEDEDADDGEPSLELPEAASHLLVPSVLLGSLLKVSCFLNSFGETLELTPSTVPLAELERMLCARCGALSSPKPTRAPTLTTAPARLVAAGARRSSRFGCIAR